MNKVEINTLKQYDDIVRSIQGKETKEPRILWMPEIKVAKDLWQELGINQ